MSFNFIYSVLKDFVRLFHCKEEQKIVELNWIDIPEVKKRIRKEGDEFVWAKNDKVETKKEGGWEVVYDFDKVKRIRYKITTSDGLILMKNKKIFLK